MSGSGRLAEVRVEVDEARHHPPSLAGDHPRVALRGLGRRARARADDGDTPALDDHIGDLVAPAPWIHHPPASQHRSHGRRAPYSRHGAAIQWVTAKRGTARVHLRGVQDLRAHR